MTSKRSDGEREEREPHGVPMGESTVVDRARAEREIARVRAVFGDEGGTPSDEGGAPSDTVEERSIAIGRPSAPRGTERPEDPHVVRSTGERHESARIGRDVVAALEQATSFAQSNAADATVQSSFAPVPDVASEEQELDDLGRALLAYVVHRESTDVGGHASRISTRRNDVGEIVIEAHRGDAERRQGRGPDAGRPEKRFASDDLHRTVERLGGRLEEAPGPDGKPFVRVTLPSTEAQGGVERPRLLVIDGGAPLPRSSMRALRADFHVTTVANESEALHAMALQTYDAVLCDVLAPGLNGIELYEHVKEAFPFLAERIVFMAGGMFDESVSDFLVSVPNRRIDKPFRPRALRDLLRHVTTGVRAAREMSAPR